MRGRCGDPWESGPAEGEVQRVSASEGGEQSGAHFGLAEKRLMGAFSTGCTVDAM